MAKNTDFDKFDKIIAKSLGGKPFDQFRGDEQHPAKMNAADQQMLGLIQSVQQDLITKKAKNPNLHLPIPDSMLTVNPATIGPSALSGFLSALIMADKEVKAEEAEEGHSPIKKSFLESCKKFLLGSKKHCHETPKVDIKDLGALKPLFAETPPGFFDGKNKKTTLKPSVHI